MHEFDIAIVGGGLVGASLARALAGSGMRTIVIDQQPADSLYSNVLDNRGLALSYASSKILDTLKVWSSLESVAYPIETVHVGEQHRFGFSKLVAKQHDLPALGYVVSASALGEALVCGLEELTNISVMRPVQIINYHYNDQNATWTLNIQKNAESVSITAKLLVAADGTNSALRKQLNIPVTVKDWQQTALITNLGINAPNLTTAYERFTKQGVLAILPFGERQVKCVWTIENKYLAGMQALNDQEFINAVQAAFGFRIGRFNSVAARTSFPIQSLHTECIYRNQVVLLGNAASTMHPVAAQGFNLGLKDAVALAKDVIKSGLELDEYIKDRLPEQQKAQRFINSLVYIFANETLWFKVSRQFGLLATQFIPQLNKRIIEYGTGVWEL